MDVKEFIGLQFAGLKHGIDRVADGLSQAEITWRPACGCNSIGLILFHIARLDDGFLMAKMLGQPQVWETEKWFDRLHLPAAEAGAHYSAEQVNAFEVPPLKDLVAYADAARANVIAYVKGLNSDQLEKKVMTPFAGEVSVAALLAMMSGHASQHIGEMAYLRGMQRGIDK